LLPDFDLIKISAELKVEPYPAGMWDELHVNLLFGRRWIWYFMQAYVPSYLTICISWVSFSLGSRAIPARTMLGVNALLGTLSFPPVIPLPPFHHRSFHPHANFFFDFCQNLVINLV
jgi:hypothetical protein